MAEQAVVQQPAIKRLRIQSKQSHARFPVQVQIQEDAYGKWCAIGSDEEEQFLNFYDEEVRAGTLRKLSKHKVEDIRSKRKVVLLKRSRQWKLFCSMMTATVGDKTWRISGNEKDELEEIVFRKRFLLDFAKTSELGSLDRGSATILLREVLTPDDDQPRLDKELVKGFPSLLSYNGNWGLIPKSAIVNFEELETADDCAKALESSTIIKDIGDELTNLIQRLLNKDYALHWAWNIEVSPACFLQAQTGDSNVVRVHLHLFLNPGICGVTVRMLDFRGSFPHFCEHEMARLGLKSTRAQNKAWCACFYVLAKKIGQITSAGKLWPFDGFMVQESWVWNLWGAGKIDATFASMCFTKIGRNSCTNLRNIESAETNREMLEIQQIHQSDNAALRLGQKQFRMPDEVKGWLMNFNWFKDRYPFLILDGPSCVGKTRFAQSLVREGAVYFCDCSNDQTPDLRRFQYKKHTLILLDECGPQQCIKLKKLLQAGADWATLGVSPTQQHAYSRYVRGCKIIVTSNHWRENCEKHLVTSEQEWLSTNSCYYSVDRPLWIVSSQPSSSAHVVRTPVRYESATPVAAPIYTPLARPVEQSQALPFLELPISQVPWFQQLGPPT